MHSSKMMRIRPLIATAVFAAIVAPTAVAGAHGQGASGSSTGAALKQVKALKRQTAALAHQVAALQSRLAELEGFPPSSTTLPGGPAGGDLTGSYPAPQLRADTVTSASVVNGSILAPDLGPNAVQSANIVDNTIGSADIANGAIAQPDLGGASVGGPQLGAVEPVKGFTNLIGGNSSGTSEANCPMGERLIGGGYEWGAQNTNLFILSSMPDPTNPSQRWNVFGRNSSGMTDGLTAVAFCLK